MGIRQLILDGWNDFETVEDPTEDRLPPGEFHAAPEYKLSRRENHGKGYHAHLEVFRPGKYVRAGYLVTINEGTVYAVRHGNNGDVLFDIEKKLSGVRREITSEVVRDIFSGIPETEMLRASSKKSMEMFKLE